MPRTKVPFSRAGVSKLWTKGHLYGLFFLYDPLTKKGFIFLKGCIKKEEYSTETICGPQSLKIFTALLFSK